MWIAGAAEPDVAARILRLGAHLRQVSPEPFCVMFTVMPVSRWKLVAMPWHHSTCTEQ
jgi:hypothetical protein